MIGIIPDRTTHHLPTAPVTLPRFKEIEQELRQRIIANQWPPGAKLPSEAELISEFGVSRITVRQALAGLHNGGLIEKVNGKGSFVTRPSDAPDLGPISGFYEAGRARGKVAYGKLVSARKIKAPAFVATALNLEPDEKVFCLSTLRFWDDVPIAYFMVMGPEPLMRRLAQEDLETNDAMSILEGRMGYRLKELASECTAVGAAGEIARRLDVPEGFPLLRVRSTPYDIEGRPLCCGELFFRGDRYSYKWKMSR